MSDAPTDWYAPLLRPALASMRAYVPVSTGPAIRLDANESPHALPPEARALLADALGSVAIERACPQSGA